MLRWSLIFVVTVLPGCRTAEHGAVSAVDRLGPGESTADVPPSEQVRPVSYTESASGSPRPATVTHPTTPAGEPVPQRRPPATGSPIHAWMSLEDYEALALQYNPALAAAAARVEAARGKWIQAGLCPNTVLGYSAGEIGARGTAGMQGGFVSQRLITGGKLRLDRAAAARGLDRAGWQLEAARGRVLSDVRIRFNDVLAAQREVDLTAELVRVGEESARASSKLFDGGQIGRTNLLQAEIEAEQARILHDNAVNNQVQAWRQLCAVVGTEVLGVKPVEGDLEQDVPELTWEACLQTVLGEHPELDAAGANVRRARLAVRRAYRQRVPDVDLMVAVRHDNAMGEDIVNVQAGLPIPWLDRNQGNIYRAESELSAARAELRKLELALEDRLASAMQRYENARQQARRYSQQILPRAEESLDLVQGAYGQGQLDYLTLLTAQRTFFQANLAYLSAVRELRRSVVVLEGKLLTDSLRAGSPATGSP